VDKVIWQPVVPEVPLEDLLARQGVDLSKRNPSQRILDLNKRLLEEGIELAAIKGIWQEVKVLGSNEEQVFLDKGLSLKGKILPNVLGKADGVVLFALTLGDKLYALVKEYTDQGNTMEAFILDTAGSAILSKALKEFTAELIKTYEEKQLKTTFTLGPGPEYWEGLDDVRTIIEFLQGEQIGITLTDMNYMLPKKSETMVMGVGANLPDFQGKTHCDFCRYKGDCKTRKLKYNNNYFYRH